MKIAKLMIMTKLKKIFKLIIMTKMDEYCKIVDYHEIDENRDKRKFIIRLINKTSSLRKSSK